MTYGGSITDDHQLFSELVCARLSEKFGKAFNCGDAGTNAYGVENMTARLLYDPVVNDADVIVVTVTRSRCGPRPTAAPRSAVLCESAAGAVPRYQ